MDRTHAEGARQKIDAELADLRERIIALSSTRNSLAPISSLPSEVMISIFLEVRDDESNVMNRTRSKATLTSTRVCSLWRDIILDCPNMWSAIDILHAEAVQAFLDRSSQTRLSIKLYQCGRVHRPAVNRILAQLPRIQDLSLDCQHDLELVGWNSPAPVLTTLHIRRVELPADAFSGSLQSLSSFSFDSSYAPTLPISSKLRRLTIFFPHHTLGLNEVVILLNQMPNLSYVCLVNAFKISRVVTPPPSQIVIPNLDIIIVNDLHLLSVIHFVGSLETPAHTQISVYTSLSSVPTLGSVDQLLQAYRSRLPLSREISTLRIDKGHGETELKFGMALADPEAPCSIKLSWEDDPLFIAAASRVFDFNTLVELVVSDKSQRIFIHPWRDLFGDMPHLRTLKVSGHAAYSFGQHIATEGEVAGLHGGSLGGNGGQLIANINQGTQLDRLGIVYRNLRELEMVFHDGHLNLFQERNFGEHPFVLDLVIRAKHGIGLTSFKCSGWPMTDKSSERIAGVVTATEIVRSVVQETGDEL